MSSMPNQSPIQPPVHPQQYAPPQQQQTPGEFAMPPANPNAPLGAPHIQFTIPQQAAPPPFQQAPQPQPYAPPAGFTMPPEQQQQAPYQFNDGLALSGNMGGGPQPQQPQPAQQPPAQPQQQPSLPPTQLRDMLAQRGLPVQSYADDDSLIADLNHSQQERQRLQQMARVGEQYLQQQQVQPPQQAPPPSGQQAPVEPEWRQEWTTLLQRDAESGMFIPKPGNERFAWQIAEIANQRETRQRERAEMLLSDPMGYMKQQGLEEMLAAQRQEILAELRQFEQDRTLLSEVDQFNAKADAVIYQRDQTGRPMVNPITGQPALTPIGQQVAQRRQEMTQWFQGTYGVPPDDALMMQMLRPLVEPYVNGQQQQAPVQQQQPQQPPAATIAGAMHQATQPPPQPSYGAMYAPNSSGTIANAANHAQVPQNSQQTFQQMLRDEAVRKGYVHPDAW